MTFLAVVLLTMKISIVLTVLSVGLQSNLRQVGHLLHHPGKLFRSLLVIDVLVPLFALTLAATTDIPLSVKIALVALSVAPVPPTFSKKALKAEGSREYSVGLLFAVALLAIVLVPLAVGVLGSILKVEARLPPSQIFSVMAMMVLAPLILGVIFRSISPGFADRIAKPLTSFATALLLVSGLCFLAIAAPQALGLARDGSIAAIVAFVVFGMAAGHVFGGSIAEERTVLAIAASTRHPGTAIAIATAMFPQEKLVLAAVALYLLVNILLGLPYSWWRRRKQSRLETATGVHA